MKKIFSTAPDGNEMADMANARYFNLAKNLTFQNYTT